MAKAMRYIHGVIKRETEKALLAEFLVCNPFNGDEQRFECWLPKSQLEVYHQFDGDKSMVWKAPLWLVNKNGIPTTTKRITDQLIRDMSC